MSSFDYNKVCRLCGCKRNFGKYIFSPESMRSGLLAKITRHFVPEVLSIDPSDGLPKFVCTQCELIIEYFANFHAMVKRVQKTLKEKCLNVSSDIQPQCHSVKNLLETSNIMTIWLKCVDTVICGVCQLQLDMTLLCSLINIPASRGRVYCCCMMCGHKSEIFSFFNVNKDSVNCPRCNPINTKLSVNNEKKSEQNEEYLLKNIADYEVQNAKKKYSCELCDKVFNSKGHVNRHKLTHYNTKPFVCDTCGSQFNQKSSLMSHALAHKQTNPFVCKWCGQSFRYKSSLQSHSMNIHGSVCDNRRVYECDRCKKRFMNKAKFKQHYRSHSGEQPYQCHICKRRFSQNVNLKTHIKKHENDCYPSESAIYNNHQTNKSHTSEFINVSSHHILFEKITQDSSEVVVNQFNCKESNVYSDNNIVTENLNVKSQTADDSDVFFSSSNVESTFMIYQDDIFDNSNAHKSLLSRFSEDI